MKTSTQFRGFRTWALAAALTMVGAVAVADSLGAGSAWGIVESAAAWAGGVVAGDIDLDDNDLLNANTIISSVANPADSGKIRFGVGEQLTWESTGGTDSTLYGDGNGWLTSNVGMVLPYVSPGDPNSATVGAMRLANATNGPCWRNSTSTANICPQITSANLFNANASTINSDGVSTIWGTGTDFWAIFSVSANPDSMVFGTGTESNAVILSTSGNRSFAYSLNGGSTPYTNPTLVMAAANPNQYATISMDPTNPNNLLLDSFLGGGVYMPDYLTFSSDPNASSGAVRLANNTDICWLPSPSSGTRGCMNYSSASALSFNSGFTSVQMNDNVKLQVGTTANNFHLLVQSAEAGDPTHMGLTTESNLLMIMSADDSTVQLYTVSGQPFTDPTVRLYSTNAPADQNEFIQFHHDQSQSVISSGQGSISLAPNRQEITKLGSIEVTQSQQILACAGGGSSTLTATSLVPVGAILLGVTGRLLTDLTGATSATLGDGSDADLFSADIGFDQGSTFGPPTAQWSIPLIAALSPVVAMSPACTAGSIAITASFISLTAPTTN